MSAFDSLKKGPVSREDIFSCLARLGEGYYVLDEGLVTEREIRLYDFQVTPGRFVSVGFEMDGTEPDETGKPIFINKKMTLRRIGSTEEVIMALETIGFLAEVGKVASPGDGLLTLLNAMRIHRKTGVDSKTAVKKAHDIRLGKIALIQAERQGAV